MEMIKIAEIRKEYIQEVNEIINIVCDSMDIYDVFLYLKEVKKLDEETALKATEHLWDILTQIERNTRPF